MTEELKIVSYNLNGVRSALSKGLKDWIVETGFDIYLFQEIKADLLSIPVEIFDELGYQHYWLPAQKKGYSGVGVLSRVPLQNVVMGMGIKKYDDEGRLIRFDVDDITFVNSYFPSGSSGEERQSVKMEYLSDFIKYMEELRKEKQKIIVSGDYNICHRHIDIHDPVSNKNSSGFLPEEREWMTQFFDSGFIDTFRHFYPEDKNHYSWWSFRANARNNNKGWRIDYHAATENLKDQLLEAAILPHIKHSDHCPVYLKIKL